MILATINRGPPTEPPPSQKHKPANGAKQNDQSPRNTHSDIPRQEPLADHKRPATGYNLQLPGHASTANSEKARDHPPPAKRPKKEKASIFMPKKPNKRPAPEDDPNGPPNSRRRL